jgi:ribosomal protein S18 acetylase RimI-like enzyme
VKDSQLFQQLIFRRAEQRDLSVILKLLMEDELGKTRESLSEVPEPCYEAAFQKITADLNHSLMVVECENQIIVICHLTLLPSLTFRGSTRLQVESVHVAEVFRGRGIGEWMFQKIFIYARQQHVSIIQLTTNKVRARAKKFYERLGFQATHEGMKFLFKIDNKALSYLCR